MDSNGATERVWLKTTGQSDAECATHGTGLLIGSFGVVTGNPLPAGVSPEAAGWMLL